MFPSARGLHTNDGQLSCQWPDRTVLAKNVPYTAGTQKVSRPNDMALLSSNLEWQWLTLFAVLALVLHTLVHPLVSQPSIICVYRREICRGRSSDKSARSHCSPRVPLIRANISPLPPHRRQKNRCQCQMLIDTAYVQRVFVCFEKKKNV